MTDDPIQIAAEDQYAEGQRKPSVCRHCGQPVWIVYHGPRRNHTLEPRDEAEKTKWTCEHGTTYSGSEDFISGARNAHNEYDERLAREDDDA